MDRYQKARVLIDNVHRRDPLFVQKQQQGAHATEDGRQDELEYADAMETWVKRLMLKADPSTAEQLHCIPGGKELVIIASRCQHLERFATPRSKYPEGKAGYLQWRRSLYTIQADHAVNLLREADFPQQECALVHKWVSKTDLKPGKQSGDWGTQLLEDAAILVFLQDQMASFARQHSEYPREKFIEIIKKTWRKLSDEGKDVAKSLDMPEPLKDIVQAAIQESTVHRTPS